MRRETAEPAAGREHPVAWDDNGERVAPEGLANGTSRPRRPHTPGDLAIAERAASWDGPGNLVDPLVKLGQAFHVKAYPAKVKLLAAQLADDSFDDAPDLWRRHCLARALGTQAHPLTRLVRRFLR